MSLSYKIQTDLLACLSEHNSVIIDYLPNEVWFEILSWANIADILSLLRVCKRFRQLIHLYPYLQSNVTSNLDQKYILRLNNLGFNYSYNWFGSGFSLKLVKSFLYHIHSNGLRMNEPHTLHSHRDKLLFLAQHFQFYYVKLNIVNNILKKWGYKYLKQEVIQIVKYVRGGYQKSDDRIFVNLSAVPYLMDRVKLFESFVNGLNDQSTSNVLLEKHMQSPAIQMADWILFGYDDSHISKWNLSHNSHLIQSISFEKMFAYYAQE